MARVAALIPDLLFGSKVKGSLEAAGHEVDLITAEVEAWDEVGGIDVLVVDAQVQLEVRPIAGQRVDDLLEGVGEGHRRQPR